ncbi:tetratricopeptide repeat protein [Oceanibacterium hippocampi]|uniref:Tetratricopeptide repeat protein n=1 Tax=Oceanibacterium hippocampi TaxID=745714 RepID=A0A1Y5SEV9_9PROT|nr:tetratricopeptide repeat protein [Oceanibacterium hippocampi]SLN38417.1 Tetratricopeptide repeat protein [Oceanibacterium hippocampi]
MVRVRRKIAASPLVSVASTGRKAEGGATVTGLPVDDPYRLGMVFAERGKYHEAIVCFEEALKTRPNDPAALFALANAARDMGMADNAIELYNRCLQTGWNRVYVIGTLAKHLRQLSRFGAAVDLLQAELLRDASSPDLWDALGSTVLLQGDEESAGTFFQEALRLRPNHFAALANFASLTAQRRDFPAALQLYDKAVKAAPKNGQLRLNRALLMLLTGDTKRGWREYEWRLQAGKPVRRTLDGLKRWDGRKIPGKRLLVCVEQGIGDQIAFYGILPEVVADAGSLVVECDVRLRPALERSFPGIPFAGAVQTETPNEYLFRYPWLPDAGGADRYIELGSLPRFYRNRIEDFPKPHAYLKADPEATRDWRAWLSTLGPGRKIGISWRSGRKGAERDRQYAPTSHWEKLVSRPGTVFVNLQYDDCAEEIAAFKARTGANVHVPPKLDQKQDIDRTLALMAGLDAVISAPNAVASMSAALGTPTYKLLNDCGWTNLGRDYEPFYPSCRIIARPRGANWREAFQVVEGILKTLPAR